MSTENHQVNMPQNAGNLPDADKVRIFDFYNLYSGRQWFNRAEIVPNHPKHMKKTLEIYCNYNPLLEMKDILSFTQKDNMAVEIIDLSHGN